jgi:hypothetical protein
MKGFFGTVSLLSLLAATATEAVNNFTNPGYPFPVLSDPQF